MTEKDNTMTANRTVREWKAKHKSEYESFKRQVAAIGSGDLSLMERTIGLLDDCMPQNARNFYAYIFKYIMNPDSVADDQAAFSDYDQLAAECIFHHAMIKVDSSTGEIEETKTPDSDSIIIRTDDLGESFESMPSSMKCVLNDLINQLVASGIDTPLADQDRIALQNLALLVTKTVYVYSLLFVPEYLEQLYKHIVVEGEPLAYCIYFFVTFDHGLRQIADVFSKQMVGGQSTSFTAEMFRMCLRTFIAHSLSNRTDTKEGWMQLANETGNDDCWKEIMFTLRSCQSHGGQQKDCRSLDELLIGDKEKLKSLIKDYLNEHPGASRLAYLLYALRQTGHIESCNYITFHRALQQMVSKPLGGHDVPQRRYHELMANPKLLDSKGKKWQQAQSIIDHWIALFHGGK
ncbi:MAG: hypothetical protein E7101_14735 [Prevotella ruminicola]|uniref:Uncharacterized protein n=1 Tax=Xylanibacter ruminicola TaxID=839 RepID=A0A9D5S8S4_XYLRU|nr:hypothetical protein [Xylanibacter ruminicola]